MLIAHLFEAPLRNGTLENALAKIRGGYLHGRTTTADTCYAYVGEQLARLQPANATVRLWGLRARDLIAHADALLADGTVVSDISPTLYAKRGYELVRTLPWAALRDRLTEAADSRSISRWRSMPVS